MGLYATTTTLSLVMVGVDFSATNMTTLGSKAIEQAENEVNKYLSKRYDLASAYFQTTTSIPPLVRSITEKLAEANMWDFLSRGGAGKESRERAKELRAQMIGSKNDPGNLMMIASRTLDLVDSVGSVIPESSSSNMQVLCNTSSYQTTFNEDDELNWAVDPTKLSDISDTRE